ncbi:rho GTPase-activating protein 22-like [Aotus nancymaae]|uniref:rho GTPase-activating protein 22-like n=1 Tax=Aotus nancymaae TaxID=37293 RepID=UPI0030FE6836
MGGGPGECGPLLHWFSLASAASPACDPGQASNPAGGSVLMLSGVAAVRAVTVEGKVKGGSGAAHIGGLLSFLLRAGKKFAQTKEESGTREKAPPTPAPRRQTDSCHSSSGQSWRKGIFGQRLEDTVHHERKYGPRLAPLLVEQCVDFIRERRLTEEGLFRMPGQANLVRDLQDSFDCGEKPLFDSTTDVHTVASLLKLYLRELPEPVVPFARYEDFLSCAQLLTKDEGEGTLELAKQVSNLPQANYNLLRYICKFLDEVQAYSNVNKMSVQNLATVFGPNILQPQVEDPITIMEGTSLIQHLMTVLIRKHSQLFMAPTPEGPTSPRGGQQCAVGWGSEEVTRDSQGEPGGPGLPTHRTSSLDGAAVAVLSRTAPTGPGSRCSPGKKVQTLPSWKSSFQQPGSRSGSPKGGGSSLEVPIISSGGNWLMNGLSSLRGHRRASSGDRLKDSGSVQRLSTYDNVPPAGLVPGMPSVASMTWSGASSSESSAGGSLSSCTACRASDSSRSSLHTEWALEASPLPSSSEDPKSLDLGHSLDEAGTGASNSEPGSPTREHARRSEALQGLIAELRAELCHQRTEYERSVKRPRSPAPTPVQRFRSHGTYPCPETEAPSTYTIQTHWTPALAPIQRPRPPAPTPVQRPRSTEALDPGTYARSESQAPGHLPLSRGPGPQHLRLSRDSGPLAPTPVKRPKPRHLPLYRDPGPLAPAAVQRRMPSGTFRCPEAVDPGTNRCPEIQTQAPRHLPPSKGPGQRHLPVSREPGPPAPTSVQRPRQPGSYHSPETQASGTYPCAEALDLGI